MNQDTPSPRPTPAPRPTPVAARCKAKNKARTRAGRIDPLYQAIKDNSKIGHLATRVTNWLKIAEFYYTKPTEKTKNSGLPGQSKAKAEYAFKLLKQMENEVKQKPNAKNFEKPANRTDNDQPQEGGSAPEISDSPGPTI